MSPREFAHYLNGISLSRCADPAVRYKIAVEKCYSRENFRVYRNWLDRELGLEDLYNDLVAQESAALQLPINLPVPDQRINPPGC
jgi:hypothetical protein